MQRTKTRNDGSLQESRLKNTIGSLWSGIYLSRLNVEANQNLLVLCEEITLKNTCSCKRKDNSEMFQNLNILLLLLLHINIK